jgi:DNA-binding MarR family transcriptional regulator
VERDGKRGRARPPKAAPALHDVDDALVRLRRLWSPGRASAVDDAGRTVEMSSLLVVEAVARGGPDGGPASVGDVAAFCDVEASTASRLVDRAVRAGLGRRGPHPADTRRTALDLTDDGSAVRARGRAFRTAWLSDVLDGWRADDIRAFAAALTRFAGDVEATSLPQRPPSAGRS